MPRDSASRDHYEEIVERVIAAEGQTLLGWRTVPTDNSSLSQSPQIRASEPFHRQVFIGRGAATAAGDDFERRLFILQEGDLAASSTKRPSGVDRGFYPVSMSSRTIVYKGMFLAYQLGAYYPDLHDPRFVSQMALVHQRFSTNTFPSWKLAHPYRMVAHNGEINTLRGNVNWMAARQASVSSPLFGDEIEKLWPISYEGQSDTACFDNALEFLVEGGYELAHAAMMLIPEAWAGNPLMDDDRRAFYEYHAALMEPWDGPAAIAFTDGRQIGATLDRNGLRPARYVVTDDGLVIMASEVGVLPVPEEKIVTKWRLQPGKMLLIDLEEGRIIADDELKRRLATANPYKHWLAQDADRLEDLPGRGRARRRHQRGAARSPAGLRLHAGGPEAPDGADGDHRPGSHRLDGHRHAGRRALAQAEAPLQLFQAELRAGDESRDRPDPRRGRDEPRLVHRAAAEPLRPEGRVGEEAPRGAAADPDQRGSGKDPHDRRHRRQPFPDADARHHLRHGARRAKAWKWPSTGCASAPSGRCSKATTSSSSPTGCMGAGRVAIPALLATAAVHNHLIRKGLRTSVGLVVETGEAREVHHFCVLAGYGAEAINPYLAFETLLEMHAEGAFPDVVEADEVIYRYIKSIGKGVLKVMSKMGISTYQSYCGAQIFDSIGLNSEFVRRFFFGTSTTIEGVGLAEIAEETIRRHNSAFSEDPGAAPGARCRRRIRLPHPRRGPHVDAGGGRAPPARRSRQGRRDLPRNTPAS